MKFEVTMLAGLLSIGAALLMRMQTQGFEAGLIAAMAECAPRGIHALARLFGASR